MRMSMIRVINGVRYNTDKAEVIASDEYWDGRNYERGGRNTHLYRTTKGYYFVVYSTQWQGERDTLEPLNVEQARKLYEILPEQAPFEKAFPDLKVEDA